MPGEESTATSADTLEAIEAIVFGSDESQTEEIEETEADAVETGDAPEEEDLQTDEEQDDAEEQPESEDDDAEENDADDARELAPEEFAELLGIDSDLLVIDDETGEVLLRTKVGEEQENVPLKSLIKSYQTDKYVTQKSQAVSEQIKAFEAEKVDYINQATQRLNEAAGLAQVFEQQLVAEYQGTDWTSLKVSDPGRYAAMRQDFADKQGQLNAAKSQLAAQAKQVADEQAQMTEAQMQEHLAKEHEAVLAAIPEWNDPGVAKAEKAAIGAFMKEQYGFSDEDLTGITDHRALLVVRDAMKNRQVGDKTNVAEKKIRKLPRIAKPGANNKQKRPGADAAQKKAIRLKKTGSVNDAAAVLMDRLF